MKVRIDREECTSCALCWDECPDLFEESPDDGYSRVAKAHRSGDDPATGTVPAELEECARSAAEGCPVEVIHLE